MHVWVGTFAGPIAAKQTSAESEEELCQAVCRLYDKDRGPRIQRPGSDTLHVLVLPHVQGSMNWVKGKIMGLLSRLGPAPLISIEEIFWKYFGNYSKNA